MHDVSEGGVQGALFEIVESLTIGIEINSSNIKMSEKLNQELVDPLCSPSYGTLIVIIDETGLEPVKKLCERKGYEFSRAGLINKTPSLIVDNEVVKDQKRVELDEVYGSFKILDESIIELENAYNELLKLEGLSDIIPQVGTNLVYSKQEAEKIDEVAGLTGRIVNAMGKPLICGEIKYGASMHLASVVLEAKKIEPSIRSAVNIKSIDSISEKLEKNGLNVKVLSSDISGTGCPVAIYIRKFQELFDAYIHPGGFGIEPTTTIIGKCPHELVTILTRLIEDD
jgi:predicted fused transcriptional regulator/phosphomethylpyrimidine kinase